MLAACSSSEQTPSRSRPAATPGVRITMAALHETGGVPPGWRLTPPPGDPAAGETLFRDLGCDSCHVVRTDSPDSPADAERRPGPELTTMGSHHPADYFLESILNPDAVLVEGPGWIGDDGRSTMPAYPDLTLVQLADLVAYLQTLTGPGGGPRRASGGPMLPQRPKAPAGPAGVFLVQTYDLKPGQLESFTRWFEQEAKPAFLARDGLVSIDTYVDNTRTGGGLVTMFGFRNDAALSRFMSDPEGSQLKQKIDDFALAHGHQVFRTPPVYRVDALSTP
jgi:hypothetical protein